MTDNLPVNAPQEILNNLSKNITPENAMMQDSNKERPDIERKKHIARLNEKYTHLKLFLNAVVVAGFDEVSSDPNSIFHIERVKETVAQLRKLGFSNVIISTFEEFLFNKMSFFTGLDKNERNLFKSYFQNINFTLSSQQKSEYKENINKNIPTEQLHVSASIIESALSNENQTLLVIFKTMFTLCNGIEIGLIGRSLRNYFKTRYPFNDLDDSNKNQFTEMMNLPLFIPSQDLTNINEQLKLWIKMIRQEQVDLCGIKNDESIGKMLEIGIDENLDQAIKNTLDKLPLLDNEQLGLSLNQIKQYIKNEEYWTYFEAGLQNFFNHQLMHS